MTVINKDKLKTIRKLYCEIDEMLVCIDFEIVHRKKIMKDETVYMPSMIGREKVSPYSGIEFKRKGVTFKFSFEKDKITKSKRY